MAHLQILLFFSLFQDVQDLEKTGAPFLFGFPTPVPPFLAGL